MKRRRAAVLKDRRKEAWWLPLPVLKLWLRPAPHMLSFDESYFGLLVSGAESGVWSQALNKISADWHAPFWSMACVSCYRLGRQISQSLHRRWNGKEELISKWLQPSHQTKWCHVDRVIRASYVRKHGMHCTMLVAEVSKSEDCSRSDQCQANMSYLSPHLKSPL